MGSPGSRDGFMPARPHPPRRQSPTRTVAEYAPVGGSLASRAQKVPRRSGRRTLAATMLEVRTSFPFERSWRVSPFAMVEAGVEG